VNAINIGGGTDGVTVSGFDIRGEVTGSYVDFAFDGISRGVAVANGATNFTISNNDIENVRNGILIDGRNTGTVTGNLIDNTKGAISVQYTDAGAGNSEGYAIDISGNHQGPQGNEWGLNTHLNGNYVGGTIHSNPYPGGAAPGTVQTALLANSAANGNWTVQDQAYTSSNRTAVTVAATATNANSNPSDANQGSYRSPLATIQAGINAVVSGGVVNVLNGVYTVLSGTYINITKSLRLIGQSESGVTIDARNASTYGLRVSGPNSNVDLENFTLYGSSNYGLKAENTSNLTLANITSRGAGKSEFDLNGILGGTLTNLTADGAPVSDAGDSTTTAGNGIGITDSQNVTLTGVVTKNNAWGGLALYQTNSPSGYPYQETGIVVDGSNTFNEANGIYAQDQSSTHDFGTIDLTGQGINYITQLVTPAASGDGTYTLFQKTEQGAIDTAVAFNTRYSTTAADVQGYAGDSVNGNNQFYVGTSGSTPLSIQAAVNAAAADATINVGDGTYTGDVTINKSGIQLLSDNGSGATTIQGVAGTSAEGTIFLTAGSNNTQIGDIGHGFTIVGFDSANPGVENSAVYIQGANSGSSIVGNRITAAGDEAILTEYGAAVSGLTIDSNTIDGQTFVGPNPAGQGSSQQFTLWNVPRQAVVVQTGATGTVFTNNVVTTVTGGLNTSGQEQGNNIVSIDSSDATITGNDFAGTTTAWYDALRVRGANDTITGNTFDGTNMGAGTNMLEMYDVSGSLADVLSTNAFINGSVYLDHEVGGENYVFRGIQNAVTAANSTDTVHVGQGTYQEQVVVSGKNLDIEGAGTGSSIIESPDLLGHSFTGNGNPYKAIVSIEDGSNVTLSGFTIDGRGQGNANNRFTGVGIHNASATLDGLDIEHIRDGGVSGTLDGVQGGTGVEGFNDDGVARTVTLENSTIADFQKNAVAFLGGDLTAVVDTNTITGAGNTTLIAQNGVEFFGLNGGTVTGSITNNTISGFSYGQNTTVATGILLSGASGTNVEGNTLTGTGGTGGYGIYSDTSDNVSITDNSVSDFEEGIVVTSGDNVGISGGSIANSTVAGLDVDPSVTGLSVSGVDFSNNAIQFLGSSSNVDSILASNTFDRAVTVSGGDNIYSLIQDGVDAAAADGTVNVAAGTYVEQVVIDKNLSLLGAGSGTVVEAPDVLGHSVDNGYGTQHKAIISVEGGADVNISDLTVDGLGKGNANYAFDGIGFFNAGGTVDNVHVTGIRDGGVGGTLSGNQDGVGVVGYNTNGTARTITLENSTIDDFQKTGAAFDGGNLTVNVTDNTVTGAGSTGVTAQNGIQFYGIAGTGNGTVTGTIAGNTVTGVSYAPVSNWSSTGILLINADGTTVANNTVTGEGTGDYSNGIYISGGDVTVQGNTVTDLGWGVVADSYYGQSNVTVENNTVTGNGVALSVGYDDGDPLTPPDTTVVSAHDNDFSNNTNGVDLEMASATADVTGNWWGTTDEGAINTSMTGPAASSVNFSSFLASGADTDTTTAGFQGDFSHLIVTSLGGGTDRLGEAVSEVDAGGTINVNAGTYTLPGMLVIDKSLSLIGAGEGATTIDGSGVNSNYAMRVRSDDVSLSGFTLEAGVNVIGGISVFSQTSNTLSNISLSNVTIDDNASGGAGLAITNTNGAALDHVTVDGMGVGGNGIQVSDTGNLALTNVITQNNQTGLFIFEDGNFAQQTTNISADTTNQFLDPAAVIIADFSAGAPGLGSMNIQGFQYAIGNENQFGNAPGQLINGQQSAIDNAVALGATDSFIEGWTGTGVNNVFQVGVSTGGTALSINTAVGAANAGGTINVATGTYGEDVSDAKQLAFNFGDVNVNSFTQASGSAGSTVKGNLTATGAIALNDAATVTGNLTSASFTSNGTLAMTGNVKASGAATFNGASTINGNVTADSITDSNTLALTGNFAATHGIALGGSSAIVGNLSGGSIASTGPLTLIGNATASGAVNLGGTTGVTGNVQGATIATTGPLTLVGDATASGDITFGGVTSVTGNVKGGTITANNTLALKGSGTASGAITANGAALLSGSLTGGSIALNGATTLTGNATLDTSAANGAINVASVDGTVAGGQSLGINAGTGNVSLGNLGATTRLGAVSDASNTTLAGSTYNANSFVFGGGVTLTAANTTLNTTQSSSAAGGITFQGDLFGTTDGGQSLTLVAGPGTGAASANGDIVLQNAGTTAVNLNNLTVSGDDFTALTVDLAGNYNSQLTGNQVFAADTLNVKGNATSNVGGNASGHIVAGGSVTIVADGDVSGTISGQNVNLTGDDVNSTVTATNSANIKGNTVEGTYNADTVTLIASNNVDAAVNATNFTLAAQHGSVDGNWTTVNASGSGVVSLNGQTTVGLANVNPNQLVVEGFTLPAGTTIGANGQLILPQGVLLGLLSPGGGKPKMILVHTVHQLGELLASGYSVIVIDLSNKDSGKPIQLASN
jgi:cytoskeletal protein CcmA (bactofilin family)